MRMIVNALITKGKLGVLAVALLFALPGAGQQLTNGKLALSVSAEQGTYQVAMPHGESIVTSRVAAEVDGHWLRSNDYPHRDASPSQFSDALGTGHQVTVTCSGLAGQPDLIYVVQLYDQNPYGTLQVRVRNTTGKQITVQAIRTIEAVGPILNINGPPSADRVLSDSFSEDWPEMKIYDLANAPDNLHRGVGSQMIYNRESKQSFFVGTLTSDRFLTILRLQVEGTGSNARVASYTADSTGTTEIQKQFELKNAPPDDLVELSLAVAPGEEIASERLLVAAGADYRDQLSAYGDAIRTLHHPRIPVETPIGWWSWTAYYAAINEAETLANADWQAAHLKSLGYKFLQVDEGYQYARGEYSTPNATQFPGGMRALGHRITGDGLTFGVWTGPFEVTSRAWVYEHHKDWLVHTAKGDPIPSGKVFNQDTDVLYTLDTTHPGAQEYLRQTYKTLVREWGVRFIKLDFMDTTAIEGFHYRPNTTALEAQRIGLQIIRDTVGDDVILDKDGSPMLNPVGIVDTGRISQDTGHSFERTKEAATGIAARFYMHRNFFVDDPDAFNTASQSFSDARGARPPLSLAAAEASIALSAVSGGMYEIGDDMLVLGAEKDRLALVENQDLVNMPKLGRASTPIDLLSYEPQDEQPSIFFLRESPRQAVLTVFNWTEGPRSHVLNLAALGLPAGHSYSARDVLEKSATVDLEGGAVRIANQPAQSVRMIMLTDTGIPESAPMVHAQVPAEAKVGEAFSLSAQTEAGGVAAVGYHWDFGDGTSAEGPKATHVYTRAADFTVQLTVDGIEGTAARQTFPVRATGTLRRLPNLTDNRRFTEPTDH
jgi:alpha-galactosidase